MLNFFGYYSLKAELVCIAILLVVLAVLLIYQYRQKKLEEKAKEPEAPCTRHENIYKG